MKQEELLDIIKRLSIWKQGNVRAPHKPLLILYALGQLQSGQTQLLPYSQVKTDLTQLLRSLVQSVSHTIQNNHLFDFQMMGSGI